jgi:hypothetical protein
MTGGGPSDCGGGCSSDLLCHVKEHLHVVEQVLGDPSASHSCGQGYSSIGGRADCCTLFRSEDVAAYILLLVLVSANETVVACSAQAASGQLKWWSIGSYCRSLGVAQNDAQAPTPNLVAKDRLQIGKRTRTACCAEQPA